MNLELEGKRALVTGSSMGIGEEIARTLAAEGATVAIHGRNAERVQAITQSIRDAGGRAVPLVVDLEPSGAGWRLAAEARERLGGVDILVNNAPGFAMPGWFTPPPEEWQRTYRINVVASIELIHALVPAMKEARFGRIIQISSNVSTRPLADMAAYGASKAAMNHLTASLALELADSGITVNTVSPGLIQTESMQSHMFMMGVHRGWGKTWEEVKAHIVEEYYPTPQARIGVPRDVAHAVAFLASPLANYIHGALLRVDGGSAVAVP
ncbi:SDR family oxidoreductase [Archangium violaceum]|uniref:SDR family NAD(P)-dependent oxidoreductase n=1 Tax=Archangium violaceum TaxID=83451 RepID=UPI00194DBAA2|nr:SDR family oxidoreductase [Archangium violaceum]QRN99560.1 SDR family oxidoreductase [Archangium violaceum]